MSKDQKTYLDSQLIDNNVFSAKCFLLHIVSFQRILQPGYLLCLLYILIHLSNSLHIQKVNYK